MPIPLDPDGAAHVLEYVGGTADDLEFAEQKYREAHTLVAGLFVDAAGAEKLPPADVLEHVVPAEILDVASILWDRRNAPGGEISLELGGPGVRPNPLDPLKRARVVLGEHIGPGFA